MSTNQTNTDSDLKNISYWIAWKYEIDEKIVFEILKKCELEIEVEVDSAGIEFNHCHFTPSLEELLKYFKPSIALKLFERCSLEKIIVLEVFLKTNFDNLIDDRQEITEIVWNHFNSSLFF